MKYLIFFHISIGKFLFYKKYKYMHEIWNKTIWFYFILTALIFLFPLLDYVLQSLIAKSHLAF